MTASVAPRPASRLFVLTSSGVVGRPVPWIAALLVAAGAAAILLAPSAAAAAALLAGPAVALRLLGDRWGGAAPDADLLRLVHGVPRPLA